MGPEWRKRIQIGVAVALAVVALRVGWIFYERSQPAQNTRQQQPAYSTNWDDYVRPHKVYAYDLKSAKQELAGKTVWVRAGNAVYYFRYAGGLGQKMGVLPPLEKLEISDVVLHKSSAAPRPGQIVVVEQDVMAVFRKAGVAGNVSGNNDSGKYAVTIGTSIGGNYQFSVNELFFVDDPHELYKHWPADTWSAIDRHEARPGMSELQAGFALGVSAAGAGNYGNRTMEYTNAGKPVTVTFSADKAVTVVPGAAQ
ncbi:MAG TPA: hypothetical protein VN176_02555 [Verrucomicrobiae bacterium]|jgi:hypothetical protein|nr:hypothetical protein [Verrucomicrobiae bacterium]